MSINYSTQLYLGVEEKESFSLADIKDKIARTKGYLDLKKLMIWDVNPSDDTKEIINFCKENKIETYLWHPVFADMNHIDITTKNMAQVPYHKDLDLSGIWDKIGKGEEGFLFVDPTDNLINDNNFNQFKSSMEEYEYDGVFLDRVRYTSPANGFESIFSTFFTSYSSYCLEQNMDLKSEMSKVSNFYKKISTLDDKKLNSFNNFEKIFEDFSSFFQYKRNQIYKAVSLYNKYGFNNDKIVGLDLLSPGLSFFTGQDYSLLSTQCDWIKTMSYCYAMGPAAFPLEIICLTNGFRNLAPKVSESAFLRFLQRHFGFELPNNLIEIEKNGVDPKNALVDLKIAQKQVNNSVPIYSGLEIVNCPYFSTKISEGMLDGYIDSLQEEVLGVVASWNIIHIPDNHFKVLGRKLI
ncbi:MAG: hypothetical protein OCD02_04240 [Spirochaetaceae bacterium]